MAKKVSWMWGGKRYYGTFIRETKEATFARTQDGKTKKILNLFFIFLTVLEFLIILISN